MKNQADITKEPYFDNGTFKWWLDEYFTEYAKNSQSETLPSIKNVACFVVIGNDEKNYVMIDNKQNVLLKSHYGTSWSHETFITRINAYKINKKYDNSEKIIKRKRIYEKY